MRPNFKNLSCSLNLRPKRDLLPGGLWCWIWCLPLNDWSDLFSSISEFGKHIPPPGGLCPSAVHRPQEYFPRIHYYSIQLLTVIQLNLRSIPNCIWNQLIPPFLNTKYILYISSTFTFLNMLTRMRYSRLNKGTCRDVCNHTDWNLYYEAILKTILIIIIIFHKRFKKYTIK